MYEQKPLTGKNFLKTVKFSKINNVDIFPAFLPYN